MFSTIHTGICSSHFLMCWNSTSYPEQRCRHPTYQAALVSLAKHFLIEIPRRENQSCPERRSITTLPHTAPTCEALPYCDFHHAKVELPALSIVSTLYMSFSSPAQYARPCRGHTHISGISSLKVQQFNPQLLL